MKDISDAKLTISKVLDGYPLLFIKEDAEAYKKQQKISVISKCPSCDKDWTRDITLQEYLMCFGILGLEICDDCSPEENITIVGNNKSYNKEK